MKTDHLLPGGSPLSSISRRPPRGFALVIVMFLLALILILVIAFAANMRTERKAAHNMAQGQRADLMAEAAVAHAVSLLADNIPDPTDPTTPTHANSGTNWLVNPGQLTLIDSSEVPTITRVLLHSGTASSPDSKVAVNLNAASPSTGNHPITGTNDPMWVSWINVLEDASSPASQANQIVGRYAFWIDDECAKINFNTARGKPATMISETALPASWVSPGSRDLHSGLTPTFTVGSTSYALGQPASVNLDTLGVDATLLNTDVAANGFFTQPEAIKNYAADPDVFYEQNKFFLTPFSRSPEFNVFGKSRIFMGLSANDLASGPLYQHAGHPDQPLQFGGDHAGVGTSTSADPTRVLQMREPVISTIAKYLNRNDWPGMGTGRFRWTSDANGQEETDQIALNIASMGWWGATSTSELGTRSITNAVTRWGSITGAYPSLSAAYDASLWRGALSGRPLLPPFPGPQITEIGCTVIPVLEGAGPNWWLNFQFALELHQPPGNFSELDPTINGFRTPDGSVSGENAASSGYVLKYFPTNLTITVTTATSSRVNTLAYGSLAGAFQRNIPRIVPRDGYVSALIPPAPYYSAITTLPVSGTSTQISNRQKFSGPATVNVKVRFGGGSGGQLVQAVPVYVPDITSGPTEVRPPSGDSDDAFVEFDFNIPANPDYVQGYTQSREVSDPRLVANLDNWPISSTDSLGFENSNADFSSSPATQWIMWSFGPTNSGISRSPASTAFRGSSIGMFSVIPTGMQRGIALESLRFNDQTPGPSELPDWLVLDLIAPTFPGPISLRNSTAGKINLNSKIYPEGSLFAPPARTAPLDALFQNMPQGSQAAAAIRAHQDAGGYFDYIGRICELPGVADNTLGPTEYEQETLLRHLASLLTTQSNTFSVWGVAQTVKKIPTNDDYGVFETGDIVTSERRFRAVVERSVWSGKEGVPGNAQTDGGAYIKTATSGTNPPNPGAPAPAPYPGKTWAEMDGPHAPQPPVPLGTVPYTSSSLESANNPLAAAMKYRIIFWEYID